MNLQKRYLFCWHPYRQIYSFIFGKLSFLYTGDDDGLVAQMVNFVEPLPDWWWDIFKHMREKSKWEVSLGLQCQKFAILCKEQEPLRLGAISTLIASRRISDRLNSLENNLPPMCKLEQKFDEKVHERHPEASPSSHQRVDEVPAGRSNSSIAGSRAP